MLRFRQCRDFLAPTERAPVSRACHSSLPDDQSYVQLAFRPCAPVAERGASCWRFWFQAPPPGADPSV